MRALAGSELSELFTRAAAAALAAATRALARISRPRSELTRLSRAFFSVGGIRIPITLADAREDFLADAREDFLLARAATRTFALDDLDACEPDLGLFAPALVFGLPVLAIDPAPFQSHWYHPASQSTRTPSPTARNHSAPRVEFAQLCARRPDHEQAKPGGTHGGMVQVRPACGRTARYRFSWCSGRPIADRLRIDRVRGLGVTRTPSDHA
jgi:hypothetical protein